MNLFLVAAAATAFAAQAPEAGANDRDLSDPGALRRWYDHARCLVKRKPKLAEKILATRPESLEYFAAFLKADTEARCFVDEAPVPPKLHSNTIRGAVAEALFLRDFSAIAVPRGKRVAPVASFDRAPKAGALAEAARRAEAFLALSECAVQLDAVKSVAVFETQVASAEEREAVQALAPVIAECIPPDLRFSVRAPVMRSYLAEAAYRVSARKAEAAE